jgi:hypothetical protein
MKQVTDPEILRQLETRTPVSDPLLLRQLEGESPIAAPATGDAPASASRAEGAPDKFRFSLLPFSFDAEQDQGNAAGISGAMSNAAFGLPGLIAGYASARGVDLAVPGVIEDLAKGIGALPETLRRSMNNDYPAGPEGEAQRERDALEIAPLMMGIPPGAGRAIPGVVGAAAKKAVPAASGVSRNEALQAAERLNVKVPTAAASDSYAVQTAGAALKELPVVGTPLVKAARAATDTLDSTAAGIADDLGAGSVLAAGHAIKDDAVTWLKTLSKDEAAEIYKPVDDLVKNATGPLSRTGVAVREIVKQSQESGLKPPQVVGVMKDALGKDMTYRAMQNLRTQIGDQISGAITPEPGMSKRALKAVYAGLSDDIEFLVGRAAGEKGKVAWAQANDAFKTRIAAKRDALTKIVGAEGDVTPEAVVSRLVQMAGAKKGANAAGLLTAKETVSTEAWSELGSAAVAQMGRDKDGFSVAKFRTEWSKLSDAGKSALLSPEHRQALDDIATVGSKFENLTKMGNPSRSGIIGLTGAGAGFAVIDPLTLIQTVAAGRLLAHVLARPATAKTASRWATTYVDYIAEPTEATFKAVNRAMLDFRSAMETAGLPTSAPARAGASAAMVSETDEPPPAAGARKAPDGEWYVEKPAGTWFRVKRKAGAQ